MNYRVLKFAQINFNLKYTRAVKEKKINKQKKKKKFQCMHSWEGREKKVGKEKWRRYTGCLFVYSICVRGDKFKVPFVFGVPPPVIVFRLKNRPDVFNIKGNVMSVTAKAGIKVPARFICTLRENFKHRMILRFDFPLSDFSWTLCGRNSARAAFPIAN